MPTNSSSGENSNIPLTSRGLTCISPPAVVGGTVSGGAATSLQGAVELSLWYDELPGFRRRIELDRRFVLVCCHD